MKAYTQGISKAAFIAELRWHQEQDALIQGTYEGHFSSGFRGCAVGCSINSINKLSSNNYEFQNHAVMEQHLGIPQWLVYLEDKIFEGLPIEKAKLWPIQFSTAIPIGADLNLVKFPFLVCIIEGVLETFDHTKYKKIYKIVDKILAELKQKVPDKNLLLSLRKEALVATTYAAYAASAAAAAAAADAADAADAAYAAYAADAAADAYGRQNFYISLAKQLLKLIKECK